MNSAYESPGDQPLLRAESLSFGYIKGSPVLAEWSTSFHRGATTAITGQSGRGKSTLLYLLGLMLRPTAGSLVINGQRVDALSDGKRARIRAEQFGFVFQDAALDTTRSVMDNITETALYRRSSRTEVVPHARTLLERFGVDVPPHRKPTQVSGGQAQRIALCRALLHSPAILLADEPTGNLDPQTSRAVIDALREHAAEGATVIIVTHSPDVSSACDRQIRL